MGVVAAVCFLKEGGAGRKVGCQSIRKHNKHGKKLYKYKAEQPEKCKLQAGSHKALTHLLLLLLRTHSSPPPPPAKKPYEYKYEAEKPEKEYDEEESYGKDSYGKDYYGKDSYGKDYDGYGYGPKCVLVACFLGVLLVPLGS